MRCSRRSCSWTVLAVTLALAQPSASSAWSATPSTSMQRRALPQFRGFAAGDPKIDRISLAFEEVATTINTVLEDDLAVWHYTFDNYFLPKHSSAVRQVFENIVKPHTIDASTGADILAKITVEADDVASDCGQKQKPLAYIDLNTLQMHICEYDGFDAYSYRLLSNISCGTIGSGASFLMMSLGGGVILHELFHLPFISQQAVLPFVKSGEVVDHAYGPSASRALRRNVNTSELAIANADNFLWFAQEMYWMNRCKHGLGSPVNSPPGSPVLAPCSPSGTAVPTVGAGRDSCIIR